MQLGDTFIMGEGGHLWVVISDPSTHPEFIIVNVTKNAFRAGKDCELSPGDHPFIKQKSYVAYGDAQRVTADAGIKLQKCLDTGAVTRHVPMNKPVLDKIVAAGKTSTALRTEYRDYL
jgi:hypothetical protein